MSGIALAPAPEYPALNAAGLPVARVRGRDYVGHKALRDFAKARGIESLWHTFRTTGADGHEPIPMGPDGVLAHDAERFIKGLRR